MKLIGELRVYKTYSVGLSVWNDPDCAKWAEINLMPSDVFVILQEEPVRRVLKILTSTGIVGWVSKKYAIDRSEPALTKPL